MGDFIKYNDYIINSSKIWLNLMVVEPDLIDVYKEILKIRHLLQNVGKFKEIIRLKSFYLGIDNALSLNLYVKDRKLRKMIHEFCETHQLKSKSEYIETNKVYKRKCDLCDQWSTKPYYEYDSRIFLCENVNCEEYKMGCESCDDVNELIEEREIKFSYKASGNMLIMRQGKIIPFYNITGCYRKYKK